MGRFVFIIAALVLWGQGLLAQSYTPPPFSRGLSGLIEQSLSTPEQSLRITGFRGAFSSRPQMTKIEVADKDGIWLILSDVQMDWRRAALLRGRLVINRLSADEITLLRLPQGKAAPAPRHLPKVPAYPAPPIEIEVMQLAARRIALPKQDGGALAFGILAKVALTKVQGDLHAELQSSEAKGRITVHWSAKEGLHVKELMLSGPQFSAQGDADFSQDGALENINLTARAEGDLAFPFALPYLGETSLKRGDLRLRYRSGGESWTAAFDVDGAETALGAAAHLALTGSGRLVGLRQAGGTAVLRAEGLALKDPSAQALLGRDPQASSVFWWRADTGWNVPKLSLSIAAGEMQAAANITPDGMITGQSDVNSPDLARISALAQRRLSGSAAVHLDGNYALKTGDFTVKTQINGQSITLDHPELDKLLRGSLTGQLDAARQGGALSVAQFSAETAALNASAKGALDKEITLFARLSDLAMFLPDFPGPLQIDGTAQAQGGGYALSFAAQGPGEISAQLTGNLAQDFKRAELILSGAAQLALANPFLGARRIAGPARFDLQLSGPLDARAISGKITLRDARLVDPRLPFNLEAITSEIALTAGVARITGAAQMSAGGAIDLTGSVRLDGGFDSDLRLLLRDGVLRDPNLYQTQVQADLRLLGPLTGGAELTGDITLGDTEIKLNAIPATGGGAPIKITHLHLTGLQEQTLRFAGLLSDPKNAVQSVPFALDLTLNAPNRLFIRGRGLDAELGGTLRLGGTSQDVIPSGGFSLIRGRLDILGRRLALSEATLQLQGNFDPVLRIVATVSADDVTTSAVITGSARDPQVSFTSSPPLPEDEILANLLFGRRLESLSAGQAIQLVGAISTLTGRSNGGIGARLRRDLGLDDLDVDTGANGAARITAGRYIGRNVYSKVVLDPSGQSEVQLNLDLRKNVTVQGRVTATGETGVGVVFTRDY